MSVQGERNKNSPTVRSSQTTINIQNYGKSVNKIEHNSENTFFPAHEI